MNEEVLAHQAQERGTVVGVGDFTSPASTHATSVRPVRISAAASRYEEFGYKLPIAQSATHLCSLVESIVWYGGLQKCTNRWRCGCPGI